MLSGELVCLAQLLRDFAPLFVCVYQIVSDKLEYFPRRFESWMTQLKQQQARHQQSHAGSLHASPHGQPLSTATSVGDSPLPAGVYYCVFIQLTTSMLMEDNMLYKGSCICNFKSSHNVKVLEERIRYSMATLTHKNYTNSIIYLLILCCNDYTSMVDFASGKKLTYLPNSYK